VESLLCLFGHLALSNFANDVHKEEDADIGDPQQRGHSEELSKPRDELAVAERVSARCASAEQGELYEAACHVCGGIAKVRQRQEPDTAMCGRQQQRALEYRRTCERSQSGDYTASASPARREQREQSRCSGTYMTSFMPYTCFLIQSSGSKKYDNTINRAPAHDTAEPTAPTSARVVARSAPNHTVVDEQFAVAFAVAVVAGNTMPLVAMSNMSLTTGVPRQFYGVRDPIEK